MSEPMFDAFTGKPLKSDPGAEAQFNSHTGPDPVPSSDASKAVTAGLGSTMMGSDVTPEPVEPKDDGDDDDKPSSVIGSDVPPFGSPIPKSSAPSPFDGPMVDAPIGANDGSISAEVETLIRETHTMVTEVHAFVAQLLEQVPTLVAAVESSPLGGMLGGLFGKGK